MNHLLRLFRHSIRLPAALALAAALATACAPQATPGPVPLPLTHVPAATVTRAVTTAPSPETSVTPIPTVSPTDMPRVVTPRGDALEATDPETVVLASGGLQLVEFFAFW